MKKIAVHRIRLRRRGLHIDVVISAVLNHFRPAGEGISKHLHSPGGDNLQVWSKRRVTKLEPHLVVPFASRAMSESISPYFTSKFDVRLSDKRTGYRCTKIILTLVDRVAAHHRVDVVFRELIHQIESVVSGCARRLGFFFQTVELFLLPHISRECNDLRLVMIF